VFERGEDLSEPRFPGLIDVYDGKKSRAEEEKSPGSRLHGAGMARDGRVASEAIKTGLANGFHAIPPKSNDTGVRA
jgi:hypothetical protein